MTQAAQALTIAALLSLPVHAFAQEQRWTADDVRAAMAQAQHPRELRCIFTAEIGGVGFNPYAVHGDAGVYGPGGLATYGLLPQFYAYGYGDRYSPYEVADYIDQVLDEGRGGNWPYLRGRLASGVC